VLEDLSLHKIVGREKYGLWGGLIKSKNEESKRSGLEIKEKLKVLDGFLLLVGLKCLDLYNESKHINFQIKHFSISVYDNIYSCMDFVQDFLHIKFLNFKIIIRNNLKISSMG